MLFNFPVQRICESCSHDHTNGAHGLFPEKHGGISLSLGNIDYLSHLCQLSPCQDDAGEEEDKEDDEGATGRRETRKSGRLRLTQT
jgi:hypothetical protein